MKEKRLTPIEAWDEFWANYMANKPDRIPNELEVAHLTHSGRIFAQWGDKTKLKKLGPLRIRRLLDKYAPGQYEFHEGSPYFTKPKQSKK